MRSENGTFDRVIITTEDITERTQVEQKMKNSLQEKEILLREIHHRVKNNLAVVSGILQLQAEYQDDDKFRNLIHECTARIQTIALVHEGLYGNQELSHVDFQQYLHQLVHNVEQTYNPTQKKIAVKLHTQKLLLDINTAMPCGLIINELLTNAYKHAFADCTDGKIDLHFELLNDRYHLIIEDNGKGMDQLPDKNNSASLGMFLIFSLAEQLKAEVTVDTKPGLRFEFRFAA